MAIDEHWTPALALVLEGAMDYPPGWPHPVTWLGAEISWLERGWNRSPLPRRVLGVCAILIVAATAMAAGWLLSANLVLAVIAASLGLAQRSLHRHIEAVRAPLAAGDLAAARSALSQVVGRDTEVLDETGIARAAIESLAESFNDGVVAPALWLAVAGLPGLFAYKAVNTADSMIGHKSEALREFGWASARLDDGLNWIPARVAAMLIVLAAGRGWRIAWRDGRNHDSPNVGWPEAAMAGALNCRLGGLNFYGGEAHRQPALGDGAEPRAADLGRALTVSRRASIMLFVLALGWGAAWQA